MSHTQARHPQLPLKDRLALHALRLKEEAQALRPGTERDAMIRRARQAEPPRMWMNGSCRSGCKRRNRSR